MRKNLLWFIMFAAFVPSHVGCSKAEWNVPPGLYVAEHTIQTYPTGLVSINGQASNYVGISTISIENEDLKIDKVYDLSDRQPKVFSFNYVFNLAADAEFIDSDVVVTVTDVDGRQTSRAVKFEFLPDSKAPWVTPAVPDKISADFDAVSGSATLVFSREISDDRGIKEVTFTIPSLDINKVYPVGNVKFLFTETILFNKIGTFDATLKMVDNAGNETICRIQFVVGYREDEDPIEDYDHMFLVSATENVADYITGFYTWLDHVKEGEIPVPYHYTGKFYAPEDNSEIFIVPTASMDGDIFGASPLVTSKILNKRGYVVPIKVAKAGYYLITIDLTGHSYIIEPIQVTADPCTDDIFLSGTGFVFGDWKQAGPLSKKGYRYTIQTEQLEYVQDRVYYFYTAGWARVFRASVDGYFWFEAATGTSATYPSDYVGDVEVLYDSVLPTGYVRKIK